jgi:hypothetical protein
MTWAELIPGVKSLSHEDKIRLLNWVTGELVQEAGLADGRQVHVAAAGLHDSYEAAAVLAQFLADHQITL